MLPLLIQSAQIGPTAAASAHQHSVLTCSALVSRCAPSFLLQVKEEITEIVQFLRDPNRFLSLGARSPAGVLLVGPPGGWYTLLCGGHINVLKTHGLG